MTIIRLIFPAGRYHATPWGRHVNEGVSEWPPSPYRLLRALYDVWQRKCFTLTLDQVESVLKALAEEVPEFSLSIGTATHTRSYLSANHRDPSQKNLVFDSFLAFESDHACYLIWPQLSLNTGQQVTVEQLLENLNYLGRSESWVEARLWDGTITSPVRCLPATDEDQNGQFVRVACAIPASQYIGKSSWMDALTFSTSNLLKEHASSPPLLVSIPYLLPESAVVTDPPQPYVRKEPPVWEVMLSLQATVRPLITSALDIAEQIRVRLMGAHKAQQGGDPAAVSPLFSGKTSDGQRRLDHGHVYILPLANKMGRIDRVLIRSKCDKFTGTELAAVTGVRKLYQPDNRGDIQCTICWQGGLNASPSHTFTKVVESATPFVLPRHWRKGRDFDSFFAEEVRRECRNHGLSDNVQVEQLPEMPGLFHEIEYRRNRRDDPIRPGYAIRLTFEAEVNAPFAIGYGAHFGLGQFLSA